MKAMFVKVTEADGFSMMKEASLLPLESFTLTIDFVIVSSREGEKE